MANPTIYYIRHGQTDWNAELRFQGQRDIPLNSKGREQANENGHKLHNIIGKAEGLDFITSPLERTQETMQLVRSGLGLPPNEYRIDDRLIEISYGDLEGTTLADLKANNNSLHRYRKANAWSFKPENGESHEMVLDRISQWHQSLECDCVVAAHGAVGRVLRYYLLDLEGQEAARFPFPQDQICIIRKGEEYFV
ncbi:MAG: histidine phosphatase family protein [Hyphomicrobiales bacterium]|nr:histidine phosphatase family protein [Hyphomicrobiales bacterium]